MKRKNSWTDEEINFLKDNYPKMSQDDISSYLGRSVSAIESASSRLKIKKIKKADGSKRFSKKEDVYILKNYSKVKSKDIAKSLERSVESVKSRAFQLGVVSCFWWNKNEEKLLVNLYNKKSPKELEVILNKKWKAISKKARKMGLVRHKSNGHVYMESKPLNEKEILFIEKNSSLLSVSEISKLLKRNNSVVSNFIKRKNLPRYYKRKDPSLFSNEILLNHIKKVYKKIKRYPLAEDIKSKDIPDLSIYYKRFGSITKAIEMCGISDVFNSGILGTGCRDKNGGFCRSKGEKTITDFFIDNNIRYRKEVLYSEFIDTKKRYRVDWLIFDSIFVEYFGLEKGSSRNKIKSAYEKRKKEKISLCSKNNIRIIAIYPKDIAELSNIFKAENL